MADVDKALPNVEQTIKIPSPEELQVEIEQTQLMFLILILA